MEKKPEDMRMLLDDFMTRFLVRGDLTGPQAQSTAAYRHIHEGGSPIYDSELEWLKNNGKIKDMYVPEVYEGPTE